MEKPKKKVYALKELPEETVYLVALNKVTYRGSTVVNTTRIKIMGKEYLISDKLFSELGGIKKMRFSAPYRREY